MGYVVRRRWPCGLAVCQMVQGLILDSDDMIGAFYLDWFIILASKYKYFAIVCFNRSNLPVRGCLMCSSV